MLRGIAWFGLYVSLVTFPLLVAALSVDRGGAPSPAADLAAGAGLVAAAVIVLELALVSRVDAAAGSFGLDALMQFHREMGVAALAFAAAHVALLVGGGAYPPAALGLGAGVPVAIRLGTLAALALALLVGSSLLRRRLRLRYEAWQVLHGLLAAAVVGLVAVHAARVGRFTAALPLRVVGALYLVLLAGVWLRYRVARPLALLRRPWEVVANLPERGASRTLVLRPVGHDGFSFQPGQFAWLNVGPTPFHLEQHPVSMSSSGDVPPGGEVSFTIRDLGDWSGRVVPALGPGRRVWVDGPYGVFSPDRDEGPGYVLVGGGVGVTPLVSMLRTLADRRDRRPVLLFHAAHGEDDLTLREAIDAVTPHLDLRVVTVLEDPPPDFTGEIGRLDSALLRRHLPPRHAHMQYFVCGPPPLMDAMERALPSLGIPADRVHTERFDLV